MAVDWNTQIQGTCGNQIISYLVLEVLGLLLDSIIMVVPIFGLLKAENPTREKVCFMMMFSIGILQVVPCPRSSLCTDQ